MKKTITVLTIAILFVIKLTLLSAQNSLTIDTEQAWLSLELGKRAFNDKDFGAALVYFDSAIMSRRTIFETASSRLDQIKKLKEAKSGSIKKCLEAFAEGDFIQRDYLAIVKGRSIFSEALLKDLKKERISDSHRAFIDILLEVSEYHPLDKLNDSIAELSRRVFLLIRYPEAEYWKGRVFFLEGELSLAETQYERAFTMLESLDVKEDQYTILYALTELYETRGNRTAWETVLQKITTELDKNIDNYLKKAMEASLLESGFDRFMTLYRFEPSYSLQANSSLAFYYLENGRAQSLQHAAIAVNMILSKAISMINSKDTDYTWAGLDDFIKRSNTVQIQAFLNENDFFKCLLCLADSLYIAGSRVAALYLWRNIALSEKKPYSVIALQRIASPASVIKK